MRDRVRERVAYERLLGALGERGDRLLAGIRAIEAAVEADRIGYVSVVAEAACVPGRPAYRQSRWPQSGCASRRRSMSSRRRSDCRRLAYTSPSAPNPWTPTGPS